MLLAFSTASNHKSEESLDRQHYTYFAYMRDVRVDQSGHTIVAARLIQEKEIKYHEPSADIFEEYAAAIWESKYATKRKLH